MVKLVILFKPETDTPNFALQRASNLALLRRMPGVQRIQRGQVFGAPGNSPAYHTMIEIFFDSAEALDSALNSPEGVAAGKNLIGFAGKGVDLLFVETEDGAVKPLTPGDLQAYLDRLKIDAEIVFPGAPTPTVPAAAAALGVGEDQIVKSVVFLVNKRPFVVYANGSRRVDPRKLAERLNVNRKQVKLADAAEVLDLTGFAVGTVPPVGLKTRMPAYMDPAIQQFEVVYAGGGGINALLKLTPAELQRATNAEIASMLRDETPAATGERAADSENDPDADTSEA